ncbi:hypothetical protein ACFSSA_13965 [Luteolibacter algae]|uniref:Type 4a pilus biogenesis protein PilO n=1 Tax=Luteolibacter algae TaxID=454151 RepID=A0ABW5D9L5_9BACT
MYKQSIIIFGLIIPLLITGVLIGGCIFAKGKITASFDRKIQYYSTHKQTQMGALAIEAMLSKQKASSDKWQELLKKETFSLVTTNLREIAEDLPPKEFQQTAFERLPRATGFGAASAQKSSGMQFNFRGTYRSVQRAFLELETRMPNLQLQELTMSPIGPNDPSLLNFQVAYTAWEN